MKSETSPKLRSVSDSQSTLTKATCIDVRLKASVSVCVCVCVISSITILALIPFIDSIRKGRSKTLKRVLPRRVKSHIVGWCTVARRKLKAAHVSFRQKFFCLPVINHNSQAVMCFSDAKGDKNFKDDTSMEATKTTTKKHGKCAQHIVAVWTTKLTFSARVRDMQFSEWFRMQLLCAWKMCSRKNKQNGMKDEKKSEKESENMQLPLVLILVFFFLSRKEKHFVNFIALI